MQIYAIDLPTVSEADREVANGILASVASFEQGLDPVDSKAIANMADPEDRKTQISRLVVTRAALLDHAGYLARALLAVAESLDHAELKRIGGNGPNTKPSAN